MRSTSDQLFTTPILFLVYNRPDVTKKVFDEIKKIKPQKLFIAADGPKTDTDKHLIEEVELIVKNIDWQCEVNYLFRKDNLGCKKAISSAIDWFFKNVEAGIILEDDCLPNGSFFYFIEAMLNRYKNEEKVMMVSGTNYLIEYPKLKYDYFFSRYFTIWGWGTWRRAWKKYDVDIKRWKEIKQKNILKKIISNFFTRKYFENAFDMIDKKLIDTWDIQWIFACLFNNGLSIVPRVNLISNIGVEGLRSRKKTESHFYKTHFMDIDHLKHPENILLDTFFDKKLDKDKTKKDFLRSSFYLFLRSSFFYKVYMNIKNTLQK